MGRTVKHQKFCLCISAQPYTSPLRRKLLEKSHSAPYQATCLVMDCLKCFITNNLKENNENTETISGFEKMEDFGSVKEMYLVYTSRIPFTTSIYF